MDELGLTLLPTLRRYNIIAEGDELDELEQDANIILLHISEISKSTGVDEYHVQRNAENVLNAIAVARQVNGKVSFG